MLCNLLSTFCRRTKTFHLPFRIHNLDARDLPTRLSEWNENVGLFDRIEAQVFASHQGGID
jgi:hypothetical protein